MTVKAILASKTDETLTPALPLDGAVEVERERP
jgi:hypothetical protein